MKSILECLTNDFVSSEVLASQLGVSSKTIRNELKEISELLSGHGANIETRPKKGSRLIITDKNKYSNFFVDAKNNCEIPETFEQRVNFLMDYLLYARDWVKIENLCDMLYLSQSTLSQCLKEARKRFYEYNIQIISKPGYGIKTIGKEFDMRLCMSNTKFDDSMFPGDFNDKKEVLKKISGILNDIFDSYSYHMSDISYQNLIVHIYVAILRMDQGKIGVLSDAQMSQIQKWSEFKIATKIVNELSNAFDMEMQHDEAGYIAIHLAAKKTITLDETNNSNVVIGNEVYEVVGHMLEAVYRSYKIDLMDDLELRMMLALHLVPFGVRMDYDIVLHNPLLKDIKTQYTMAYNLAVTASEELRKYYNKNIKEDEIGYFALHFNLALERKKKKLDKKNILIVCGTGRGTAQLLLYQFKENFGKYLNDVQTCDVLSVKNVDFSNVDYVITTVQISCMVPVPILEIKSFMQDTDVKNIRKFLSQDKPNTMKKYLKKDLFITDVEFNTKEEVLQYMTSEISKVVDVPYDFYDAVMYRERQAVTEFGNMVAIPHPNKAMTKETFVCICILNKPILWEKKKVQLIYLMAMEDNPNRDLMTFYKITSKLLVNPMYVKEIIQKRSFDVVLRLMDMIEMEIER